VIKTIKVNGSAQIQVGICNSTTSRDIPLNQKTEQVKSSQVDDFTGSEHKALPLLYARRFGFDFDTFLLEHWEARLLI
jgi:hypothetical protein